MDGHTSSSEDEFASSGGVSLISYDAGALTLSHGSDASSSSDDSDALLASDASHTSSSSDGPDPSSSHSSEASPRSQFSDASPSPHESDELSYLPLSGSSYHTAHYSPVPQSRTEQRPRSVSQPSAQPRMTASTVEELARSTSWRVLRRQGVTSASEANEMDQSAQRYDGRDMISDEATDMMPAREEEPQHAPRSLVSDLISIFKHHNHSSDPVERELLGQMAETVRATQARYLNLPSHTPVLQGHPRVQSKGISDELIAYMVPPIVSLPPSPRHSSPSRIPRAARNPSPRIHSPTRLDLSRPISDARAASIDYAFARVAPTTGTLHHRPGRRERPVLFIATRYAGPTFNASPPPSALPVPAFARRSVRTESAMGSPRIANGGTTTPLCVVDGDSRGPEGQTQPHEPEPPAIGRPVERVSEGIVLTPRELPEIRPAKPPTPPLDPPDCGHECPEGQVGVTESESLDRLREMERASEATVIETRNEDVRDHLSSRRASSIPVASIKTDTPTATGAINTESAQKESETPTTRKPLENPTSPQDISPQPFSRPTTPITLGPSQVTENKSNAKVRPDTPHSATDQPFVPAPTLSHHTFLNQMNSLTRPLWLDQSDKEFEATRPISGNRKNKERYKRILRYHEDWERKRRARQQDKLLKARLRKMGSGKKG